MTVPHAKVTSHAARVSMGIRSEPALHNAAAKDAVYKCIHDLTAASKPESGFPNRTRPELRLGYAWLLMKSW